MLCEPEFDLSIGNTLIRKAHPHFCEKQTKVVCTQYISCCQPDISYSSLFCGINMNPALSQVFVDPNGDVELVIRDKTLVVSSRRMSAISPEFQKLFNPKDGPPLKTLVLPNEDSKAFCLICQLAHGIFISKNNTSLEMLVEITSIIRRYDIPITSTIYQTANYFFHVRTTGTLLRTLSPSEVTTLLQVARNLGSAIYRELLKDVFFLCSLEVVATGLDLGHLNLKGVACRIQIVCILWESLENYTLVSWIFTVPSSLYEIQLRLQWAIERSSGHGIEHLRKARHEIDKATANFDLYLQNAAEMEIVNKISRVVPDVRSNSMVRRLEVQIACDEQDAEASSPVSVSSTSSASSSYTNFEDIVAYSEPVDKKYDLDLGFDDSDSVRSCKTI
jgi:hypothetical protein